MASRPEMGTVVISLPASEPRDGNRTLTLEAKHRRDSVFGRNFEHMWT